MDVSFWGPSGWELLHLITFTIGGLEEKKLFLSTLDEILPCKYCRQSSKEFLKEEEPTNNTALWLYEFHEKVNTKLRNQHNENPNKVPLPEKSPSFEIIIKKYRDILKNRKIKYPGLEFLLSIAFNFDCKKLNTEKHTLFWKCLIKLYPYYELRKKLFVPNFKTYFKDVYKMFSDMGYDQPYKETKEEITEHKSSCSKKKVTCRK